MMRHVSDVVIIQTRRGRDGKDYPPDLPRPRAELNRIRWLTHRLHCEQGLSEAATRRELLQRGYRRSAGIVHRDLVAFECPVCAGGPPEPEAAAPPPVAAEPEPARQQHGPAASSQQHSQAAVGAGWAGPQPW